MIEKVILTIVIVGILIMLKVYAESTLSKTKGIPKDILNQLRNDFPNEEEYKEAITMVNNIKEDDLNVGWIQLSRAIILIANGDIRKMKEIKGSEYYGDPRDVIMEMMSLPGNKNDNGLTPFK